MNIRLGIDLGGTKIEGIALDGDGNELIRQRAPTPQGDYSGTVSAIRDLVGLIASGSGADGSMPVGIGIPGAISPHTGLVKNANSVCLIGNPLDKDVETALNRPVRMANDADCFTISEATDGAGAGSNTVFGVIIGTGVGGGVYANGGALKGNNAIAGEWGHNPLPWMQTLNDGHDERPGPDCYCGKNGCIEKFLSGPSLSQDHQRATSEELTSVEIVTRAEDGDRACEATMYRYEHRLARGLATIINVLDPDVIVLGGGMSNVERLYKNVPILWQDWIFSDHAKTRLLKNIHGNSSGVRGAAWLWD